MGHVDRHKDAEDDTRRGGGGRGGRINRLVARLAASQHGIVGREQLMGLGLSEAAISGWVSRERLTVVHRGVYAFGHRPLDLRGRWFAGVLAAGPLAVLSHRSAAALWDIASVGRSIEVTAPTHRQNVPGLWIHRTRTLGDDDTTVNAGIPVTTPARTLIDLAEVLTPPALVRAFEEAERLGLLDMRRIEDGISRNHGRHGLARLRKVLQSGIEPPDVRSKLERRFAEFCRRRRLPRPALNAVVCGHLVDAVWPGRRLVVEIDSYRHHRGRTQFEEDRMRDADLLLGGYRVLRITARRLDGDADALERAIRSLLGTTATPPTIPASPT